LALWLALTGVRFLLLGDAYEMHIADLILIEAIAALGVNIILGYAGLVSIAHAAVMALGAYTSALLAARLGLPFPATLIAAGAVGAIVSALIGLLGNRVSPNYLLVITTAIQQVVYLAIVYTPALTGGSNGMFVPFITVGPITVLTDSDYFFIAATLFVVGFFLAQRLRSSRMGRAVNAGRLNPGAAAMSGIDVNRDRVVAMSIGGAYLAVSGSLTAHLIHYIGPDGFGLSLALLLTLIVVVGGLGSNIGSVVSVVLLTIITEQFQGASATTWVLYYGILIIGVMMVAPHGLANFAGGRLREVRARFYKGERGDGPYVAPRSSSG
jgi:branched-chain amino acid transport system permease protein